jgi:hypothetical protein
MSLLQKNSEQNKRQVLRNWKKRGRDALRLRKKLRGSEPKRKRSNSRPGSKKRS